LRLRLDDAERELMTMLLDELQTLLENDAETDDAAVRRLFPAAYRDDEGAEQEYRALTESSLRSLRTDRIDACRADLATDQDIDLADPDAAQRWIQVLNDLRLALGTRLGVSEEDEPDVDPTDPEAQPRVVYYWLTAVQDSVVASLMR
jgi:hypothetical protein